MVVKKLGKRHPDMMYEGFSSFAAPLSSNSPPSPAAPWPTSVPHIEEIGQTACAIFAIVQFNVSFEQFQGFKGR